MEMAIQTSFLVSRAQTADTLVVWAVMTRSEKSRRTDLRESTAFLLIYGPISVLTCPSNRLTSRSTDSQPKGVASTDDGTVSVVTASSGEVYCGGNVAKKDCQLKANLHCIAVHGKTAAVGGRSKVITPFQIPSSVYPFRVLMQSAQDKKLYLYSWDGTSLKEAGYL